MADFSKLVEDLIRKKMADLVARERVLNYLIENQLSKEIRWELINEARRAWDLAADYEKPNVIVQWFKRLFKRSK